MSRIGNGTLQTPWSSNRVRRRSGFPTFISCHAKTPTCCPSDDNRTKVTNSVTSALSLWWQVGPYFWPADLTRTANPIATNIFVKTTACAVQCMGTGDVTNENALGLFQKLSSGGGANTFCPVGGEGVLLTMCPKGWGWRGKLVLGVKAYLIRSGAG